MSTTPQDKIRRFRALHAAPGLFVIPNPWDAGSARILAGLGYQALATSSAASANTLGRRDYNVTRDEALAMAQSIVGVVDLPVSADLENGFGDAPEMVADTIQRGIDIGLAGGSIEDAAGGKAPYDLTHAAERVAAAAEVARKSGFVLTARAENYLRGVPNLDDTIKRLQAYEMAGADVLFAPGLPDFDAIRAVCAAVSKPVNYMCGARGKVYALTQLAQIGVKRVSVATAFYRAAMDGLLSAAREVLEQGAFSFVDRVPTSAQVAAYMRE